MIRSEYSWGRTNPCPPKILDSFFVLIIKGVVFSSLEIIKIRSDQSETGRMGIILYSSTRRGVVVSTYSMRQQAAMHSFILSCNRHNAYTCTPPNILGPLSRCLVTLASCVPWPLFFPAPLFCTPYFEVLLIRISHYRVMFSR